MTRAKEELLVPEFLDDGPEAVSNEEWRALIKKVMTGSLVLGDDGARLLLGVYYDLQAMRVASYNRLLSISGDAASELMGAISGDLKALEKNIYKALGAYAKTTPWGQWALKVKGIGPVVSAGLCAYVNPELFASVGKVWRFFGLDPTAKWEKGQRRPYSHRAKQLAYYIGESIIRTGDRGEYGPLFKRRKAYEWEKNLSGQLAEAATAMRSRATDYQRLWVEGRVDPEYARRVAEGKASGQSPVLLPEGKEGIPMLPPLIIHARARRWIAKLVLSHFWEVRYWYTFGKRPPLPYAIAHKGHVDYIPPPYAPWE